MNPVVLQWLLYAGAMGLIVIGIAGVVLHQNIFRMVLALAIAEAGANLLLVIAGFRFNAVAPILQGKALETLNTSNMVDPVPQAMVLTSIVIGVGIQALALALIIKIQQRYGNLNMRKIHARMSDDINKSAGVGDLLSAQQPAGKRPLPTPAEQRGEA
jgi:multisubunit Na+/H+ antiporter MnhC subunit